MRRFARLAFPFLGAASLVLSACGRVEPSTKLRLLDALRREPDQRPAQPERRSGPGPRPAAAGRRAGPKALDRHVLAERERRHRRALETTRPLRARSRWYRRPWRTSSRCPRPSRDALAGREVRHLRRNFQYTLFLPPASDQPPDRPGVVRLLPRMGAGRAALLGAEAGRSDSAQASGFLSDRPTSRPCSPLANNPACPERHPFLGSRCNADLTTHPTSRESGVSRHQRGAFHVVAANMLASRSRASSPT